MNRNLLNIEQLARQAGNILLEGYGKKHPVQYKGSIDLVTQYDQFSESVIISKLKELFPNHSIFAEESGWNDMTSDYVWFIDPLDGTTNFVNGIPAFAVSIALSFRQQLILGVVYDPLHNELFSAELDCGATLNGQKIQVSEETVFENCILSTGFPYDLKTNPNNSFRQFIQFHKQVRAVRYIGSATLNCVWVALGRFDGYWEYGTKPWDTAAGALIVREAGGRVSTDKGDQNFLGQASIVVSNNQIHSQMLEVLESSRKP